MVGGRALAEGVGSLSNIGDAIEKALERKKHEVADAKRFEASYKTSDALQKVIGLSPEEFSGLSAKDKIAKFTGAIGTMEIKRKEEESGALQDERMARVLNFQQQQQDRAAQGRVAGNMQRLLAPSMAMQPGEGPLSNEGFDANVTQRTGLSPAARALIQGSAEAGAPLPPSVLDDLIKGGAAGANTPDSFVEDPLTGSRFLASGKTRLPSGTNPSRFENNAIKMVEHPVTGQALGFWINHAGAKPVWKSLPSDVGLTRDEISAMNTELRPWGDAVALKLNKMTPADAEKKIDAIREKYLGIAARRRGGGSSGRTVPAPGTMREQAGRVTVTKDGKQFTLPASQLDAAKRQGYQPVQ